MTIEIDGVNNTLKTDKIEPQSGTALTVGTSGDTVTVPTGVGLTVTDEVKTNKVSPATGTALQISDSGDTVTLPSGATLTIAGTINATGTATGFGAIDWQTGAIKTSTFTGVAGEGYFVNTAGGAVTANLPASPSAGDQMAVSDYGNNTETNGITVGRNGSNIEGSASDYSFLENGAAANFIYVDGTKGWIVISTADSTASASDYVIASGGTESTSGNEKIHVFNSSGTFTVSSAGSAQGSNTVTYLVIAGGGGGGNYKGGGGGGGFRTNYGPGTPTLPGTGGLSITAGSIPITVGGGGVAGASDGNYNRGTTGSSSIFSSITSTGGGGGGTYSPGPGAGNNVGLSGGSGGGGGVLENPKSSGTVPGSGGAGNTPPVSPSQGNPGGLGTRRSGTPTNDYGGGGGGGGHAGAGSAGTPGDNTAGGAGGAGTPSQITGSDTDRSGGGGGNNAAGGGGGGGAGADTPGDTAGAGTANQGGGGGAGKSASTTNGGGAGGSGIVVIRYKYQN